MNMSRSLDESEITKLLEAGLLEFGFIYGL